MKEKTIAVLSGGLDSTVLAYWLAQSSVHELIGCVTVDYGQRHRRELMYAAETCKKLEVPHHIVDLSDLRSHLNSSSLTSAAIDVPHGHYAEENMKSTVVPNRNMILLAIAAGIAISKGASLIAYGAHAGDHAVYADCRPEFADAMDRALAVCDFNGPRVVRPFIHELKHQIVKRGGILGVPFQDTWTCYEGDILACGRCGTCVERLEAFSLAKLEDPLEYKDRHFWKSAVNG